MLQKVVTLRLDGLAFNLDKVLSAASWPAELSELPLSMIRPFMPMSWCLQHPGPYACPEAASVAIPAAPQGALLV